MDTAVEAALRAFVAAAADAAALMRLKTDLMGAGLAPAACVERVLAVLRRDRLLRDAFAASMGALLASRRHRYLYADTGVLEPLSFGRTLRYRLGARLLPHPPDPALLRDLVADVFARPADAAWVQAVPATLWAGWFELVQEAPAAAAGLAQARAEADAAIGLLAARVAGLAADPDRLRYRQAVTPEPAGDDEALGLPAAAQAWIEARAESPEAAHPREFLRRVAAAEAEVAGLRAAAPTHGTSVALTHSLHAAAQALARLRTLVLARTAADAPEGARRAAALFVELVAAQGTERSLRQVFAHALDDVAQQVTEHASQAGEHYVTDDRAQWWAMLRAAAGAGAIVAVMALLKILLARAPLAPLWAALGVCLNYGLGFVLIHLLHFTVATKQPALTATLLAARLGREEATPAGAARLADLVVRTVRTQVVAIVGNVALAVPVAAGLCLAAPALHLAAPVTADKAAHLLAELHPWHTGSLAYAAIAGGCLFLAGLVSGYYDNLCVVGRVGERLAGHPGLLRLCGPARTARLAAYVERELGALLGNLAFGFMLGGVGFVGFITGLPLEIRHVAFASANAASGLATLGAQVPQGVAAAAVAGVLLVALVNVAVSFGLAFVTAFRARRVRYDRARLVLRLVGRRLLRRPWDFVWPPPDGMAAA